MVNAATRDDAHLRVVLVDILHVPYHVLVKRTAGHSTTVAIVAERTKFVVLGRDGQFANLGRRVSVAHYHAVHARAHEHFHDGNQVTFRKVRAQFRIDCLAEPERIAEPHDFGKDAFREAHVQVYAGFARIGAADVNFDIVGSLVGDRETFDDILQFFFGIGEARSLGNRDAHAEARLVRLHQLLVDAARDDFDAFVVEAHAIVDGSLFFEETDAGLVRIAFAEITGRCPYRDAAKADVCIVANSFGGLVRPCSQNNRTTEIKGIAVVGKGDDPLQRLAQVRPAAHKGYKRSQAGNMLKGIVTEFRIIVEHFTYQRQNPVAKTQVILVINAFDSHIIINYKKKRYQK